MIKHTLYFLLFLLITINISACSSNKVKSKTPASSTVGKGNTIDCSKKENKQKSGCVMLGY